MLQGLLARRHIGHVLWLVRLQGNIVAFFLSLKHSTFIFYTEKHSTFWTTHGGQPSPEQPACRLMMVEFLLPVCAGARAPLTGPCMLRRDATQSPRHLSGMSGGVANPVLQPGPQKTCPWRAYWQSSPVWITVVDAGRSGSWCGVTVISLGRTLHVDAVLLRLLACSAAPRRPAPTIPVTPS